MLTIQQLIGAAVVLYILNEVYKYEKKRPPPANTKDTTAQRNINNFQARIGQPYNQYYST